MSAGLFVVGTDTGVGKTAVAAAMLRQLAAEGHAVGAYKPVATGLPRLEAADGDPFLLWEAAGRPRTLADICPQVFKAAISPPRSGRAEGRRVDERLLRTGLDAWSSAEVVVVEGAGGLFSPLGEATLGVDLAREFGFPLVIVDAARLGGIGRMLCSVRAARAEGLAVAACVFSEVAASDPESEEQIVARHTADDLAALVEHVPVTVLWHGTAEFDPPIDWWQVATSALRSP